MFELLFWVSSVLCLACSAIGFKPADNYLIDCGSLTNNTVSGRVFMADDLASKFFSAPRSVVGNTSKSITSSAVSRLYRTARIFTDLSLARFDVSTENHVLLSSLSVGVPLVKEFSVNVTTNSLTIIFTPSENSFAFINALEVVSAPDQLIPDNARTDKSSMGFQGLMWQALETVARVNMGGPMASFDNDTLSRTWVPEQSFLIEKNLASTVSNIRSVKYVDGGSTPEIAPASVYGTCTKMNSLGDPNSNFDVTWEFDVDQGFQYLVRFNFCDIVSTTFNQLYFNIFIDSSMVVRDLDLSTYSVNVLAAAYYMDYVTDSTMTNKLRVSSGPSNLHDVYPYANHTKWA
ncbi:putative receptor-like protein kinase [Hibiscus syriacus]|uniref:Receptor-like protein kinase n=1 Tax=Hibiscus syriacus TaxID=106335 RepID=A0A6A3C8M2_HIBSY|nr:putative receptor-like protein kinase [Hibiscus syriacus]